MGRKVRQGVGEASSSFLKKRTKKLLGWLSRRVGEAVLFRQRCAVFAIILAGRALYLSLHDEGAKVTTVSDAGDVQLAASLEAEKVAALRTATYVSERRERADCDKFDRLMSRKGGEPPRAGDELPEGFNLQDHLAKAQACPGSPRQPE